MYSPAITRQKKIYHPWDLLGRSSLGLLGHGLLHRGGHDDAVGGLVLRGEVRGRLGELGRLGGLLLDRLGRRSELGRLSLLLLLRRRLPRRLEPTEERHRLSRHAGRDARRPQRGGRRERARRRQRRQDNEGGEQIHASTEGEYVSEGI